MRWPAVLRGRFHRVDCILARAFAAHHDNDGEGFARLDGGADETHVGGQPCRGFEPYHLLHDADVCRLDDIDRLDRAATLEELIALGRRKLDDVNADNGNDRRKRDQHEAAEVATLVCAWGGMT